MDLGEHRTSVAVDCRPLPAAADIDCAAACQTDGIQKGARHHANGCAQNRNRSAGLTSPLAAYVQCATSRDKTGISAVEDDRATLVMDGTGVDQSAGVDDIAYDIASRPRGKDDRAPLCRHCADIGCQARPSGHHRHSIGNRKG